MFRKGNKKLLEEQRQKKRGGRGIAQIIKQKFVKKEKTIKNYNQFEVLCDYCQCKVKKYSWLRHVQTEKHKQNEICKNDDNEKVNNVTDEEKDEDFKIKK